MNGNGKTKNISSDTMTNSPSRVRIFLVSANCFLVFLIYMLTSVNMSIAVISISDQYDWNLQSRSIVLAAYYVGFMVSQIPGGKLADNYGGHGIILFAVLIWSISTALTPLLFGSIPILSILRAFVGLGQGMAMPAVNNIISSEVPFENGRDHVLSFSYSGFSVGAVVGLIAVERLITLFNTTVMFLVCGAVGIIWMIFFYLSLMLFKRGTTSYSPDSKSCTDGSDSESSDDTIYTNEKEYAEDDKMNSTKTTVYGSFDIEKGLQLTTGEHDSDPSKTKPDGVRIVDTLKNRPFLAAIVGNTCFSFGYFVCLSWLPSYVNLNFESDISSSAIRSTIPWMSAFIFSNIGAILSSLLTKFGVSLTLNRKIVQGIAFFLPAILLPGVIVTSSANVALALLTLSLGFTSFTNAAVYPNHQDLGPEIAGTLIGISNTIASVPGVIGVLVTGFIVDSLNGSWNIVFGVTIGFYILGFIIFSAFGSAERQW